MIHLLKSKRLKINIPMYIGYHNFPPRLFQYLVSCLDFTLLRTFSFLEYGSSESLAKENDHLKRVKISLLDPLIKI